MNFAEFENDTSIIIKAHSLSLNRNKNKVKLILILHNSYEVIEIKIYDNGSNKLIGREILTYSDFFLIFNDYFICFNENIQQIYQYINNCIRLNNYEMHINEITKKISLEIFILKDNKIEIKDIFITTCNDEEKYKLVSEKIKEFNSFFAIGNKIEKVAPFTNYIKYENNTHYLFMDLYIEKEIEILVMNAKLVEKNNLIINMNNNDNKIYAAFFSKEEINKIFKNYYELFPSINEILDDIKLNISNKNIKIDNITNEKIKITISVISSFITSKFSFELTKGLDIKDKYIQIIKELRMKNEFLANSDILQSKEIHPPEPKNKNNGANKSNNNNNSQNNQSIIKGQKKGGKKVLGKKRKRFPVKKSVNNRDKKEKKDKKEEKDDDNADENDEDEEYGNDRDDSSFESSNNKGDKKSENAKKNQKRKKNLKDSDNYLDIGNNAKK